MAVIKNLEARLKDRSFEQIDVKVKHIQDSFRAFASSPRQDLTVAKKCYQLPYTHTYVHIYIHVHILSTV